MSNIHVVNLSSYTTPEIKEFSNREWVSYGDDNNYFQFLIDRYNGSPTNNAIINGISELIYGRGLDASDSSRKPEAYAQMRSLFKKEDLRKATSDFKMMGQCAFQVIYSQDHNMINEVYHLPIESLRAEKCNEEGEIEAYYYAKDWGAVAERKQTPTRIPAFGFSNEGIEILYIKPYRAGFYYYSPVDYQGGLQYAELEEEVANYHLNNIKNGMSPSMLINFNNGVPTEEERYIIENKISEKFSGSSNAGKFILAFNDNKELSATIEPVQLNDASQQYQFLADESMRKIMVAHRVTSPMLLGIKDQSGLGNNAEELMTASTLFDNIVIRPMQETILDGIDKILAYNDISLDIYFKTLQPIEFSDVQVVDKATMEQETGVKLSAQGKEPSDQELDILFNLLEELGEEINEEEWELVDERPVDYDQEEALDKMLQLASTGSANTNAKSSQDGVTPFDRPFKVRYQYSGSKSPQRDFCRKMMAASKVYRKEDILSMGEKAVNAGFGVGGSDTYSIWLYKGGARCKHFWTRKTFMAKEGAKGVDAKNPNAEVSTAAARRAGAKIETNPREVSTMPSDMDYSGYTPEYARTHGIPK